MVEATKRGNANDGFIVGTDTLLEPKITRSKMQTLYRNPTMINRNSQQNRASKGKKKPVSKKPKVTQEQLKAVIFTVISEADDDGNGDLDINECRPFLKKLLAQTYPEQDWDDERYK